MIQNDGDGLSIRDLGSRNGTFVNGEPVMKAKLSPNDAIMLGTQHLELKEKATRPETPVTNRVATGRLAGKAFTGSPKELIRQIEAISPFSSEDSSKSHGGSKSKTIKERYEAMRSLFRISTVLASESDIAVKLQLSLDEVVHQLGGECGYILLTDEKTGRLVPLYSCSLTQGRAAISKSLVDKVAGERLSILTGDAMADSRFLSSESVSNFGIHSAVAVPIFAEDDLLGVLYISHHDKTGCFKKKHLEYASAVGRQMGVAARRDTLHHKNRALLKHLGNARKVLEQRGQKREKALQRALAQRETAMRELLSAEKLSVIGLLCRNVTESTDQSLAMIKPRVRFLEKYVESLETACASLEAIPSSVWVSHKAGPSGPEVFFDPLKKIRESLSVLKPELEEIDQTLRNLQSYSKRAEQQLDELDIDQIIDTLLALLRPEMRRHSIEVIRNGKQGIRLFCDVPAFNQTMLHIILNSIESLAARPPVKGHSRSIWITTETNGEDVILTVRDNGTGIADEDLPNLCDLFFTTHRDKGQIGLGLYKARDFAMRHRGKIEIRRVKGNQTEVRLILPLNLTRGDLAVEDIDAPDGEESCESEITIRPDFLSR